MREVNYSRKILVKEPQVNAPDRSNREWYENMRTVIHKYGVRVWIEPNGMLPNCGLLRTLTNAIELSDSIKRRLFRPAKQQ
jgi:hypothetical protein